MTRSVPAPAATEAPRRPAPGLPRLLATPSGTAVAALDAHRQFRGELPNLSSDRVRADVFAAVERSGLRGRGGSGFPTATKLRAVAAGRGRPVVVVNGMEGEPASHKDTTLFTTAPHLVLDGAIVAAHLVGAHRVVVAIGRDRPTAIDAATRAVAERRAARLDELPIDIVAGPARYVAGEESALVHWLNGGDAKPTKVPPRPFERGVGGNPTLVQNAETLAHLALIARHGDAWFRAIGTAADPGSTLITLGGAVARPGVYEIALGSTLAGVIDGAGGPVGGVSGVLVGGYFGGWVAPDQARALPLAHTELRAVGRSLGAGIIVVLPADACGLRETARAVRYLADETAQQCGPCVNGLDSLAGAFEQIAAGHRVAGAIGDIRRWCGQIAGRGACHHPDGAIALVTSALEVFAPELSRHQQRNHCSSPRSTAVLPIPSVREKGWR